VCGSRDLIDYLYQRARPFLFSTSHPPAVAAACLAAFDILEQEPERIDKLWSNTRFFQEGLRSRGFFIGASETPITPIMVGEASTAHSYSRALFDEGCTLPASASLPCLRERHGFEPLLPRRIRKTFSKGPLRSWPGSPANEHSALTNYWLTTEDLRRRIHRAPTPPSMKA